jgi:hypothetical protein
MAIAIGEAAIIADSINEVAVVLNKEEGERNEERNPTAYASRTMRAS